MQLEQVGTERPIVDGFTYSMSLLYLPTAYRASALAQMDVLRRAKGYRTRWYTVPEDLQNPVPAYGQLEYQVGVQNGSYVWGLSFSAPFHNSGEDSDDADFIHIQITDTCTETPFFSDYAKGIQFEPVLVGGVSFAQQVTLLTPRLIGEPSMLNVELYNRDSHDIYCQLMILVAEPSVPPEDLKQVLLEAGLLREVRG